MGFFFLSYVVDVMVLLWITVWVV